MKFFESGTVGEGFLADDFDGAGYLEALDRKAIIESAFFDLFNPCAQAKLFEPGTVGEGGSFDRFNPRS